MSRASSRRAAFAAFLPFAVAACGGNAATPLPTSKNYSDLTALFTEWRAFQRPVLNNGVPDYTAQAMAAQQRGLAAFQRRLAAIDRAAWPVDQQVDWYVVRAEMNGLDFDQRVLRPWANNPAFYVTVFADQSDQPLREGPLAYGATEVWSYRFPLSAAAAAKMDSGVRIVPALLKEAEGNLIGTGHDLWVTGAQSIREQSGVLAKLAVQVKGAPGSLAADVEAAKSATDSFAVWLDKQIPQKAGPSGVGVENYDWYLVNVQMVPLTWRDEVTLMQSELARAWAMLAIEEHKNAKLPLQVPVGSQAEHARRFNAAITEYVAYLRDHQLMTVAPYVDSALRSQIGTYAPPPFEFFTEVDYRDPEVMRTHGYHWIDNAQMALNPNPDPIRRGPLLYNIFNTRTEGGATWWEEMMLQAGMFDARPRSRELVYILLAERAARALGDLHMVSNEFTLEQASAYASSHTPRGWLSLKGNLVRGEQHLYLQQPGYGTSYLIGKMQIEAAMAARKMQLGDKFSMKEFMDAYNAAGLVPASLLRWQLTGEMPEDVKEMLSAP